MEICLTTPASGVAPALLAGRFDPMKGACALFVGPAETQTKLTRKSVAFPVFRSLGKNSSLVGSYTNSTNEYRSFIATWFAAYETKDLVVFNGKVMSHGTLAGLFEYAAPVERVTFVAEPGDLHATQHALRSAGHEAILTDWADLLDRLPVAQSPAPETEPTYNLTHLPVCDFLLFRNRARALNTAERFEAIDADYRRAYSIALTVEPDMYTVIDAMADQCREATSTAQMMVTLRGTQQALLTRGWHLAAHADKTLGTLSSIKPPAPTDADWRALHGYTVTRRPATAALYLLDVPRNALAGVTMSDVDQWLGEHAIGGRLIPPLARVIIRAHYLRRIDEGAQPGDFYLAHNSPTGLVEDLTQARRHTGIPMDGRYLRRDTSHTARPLTRIGLNLRSLT
jgi:hypothetical protein